MAIIVGTNSYVTEAEASTYLAQSSRAADAWLLVDSVSRERALVTATRYLDRRLTWQGTKTVSAQALQWPRTGVVDRYGNAVATGVVHAQVKDAQIELAFELSQDTALETKTDDSSIVSSASAGSVSVSFLRASRGSGGKLPSVVHDLIREFLAGAVGATAPVFSQSDDESFYADDGHTYDLSEGWS